jgi:protein gp37
MQQTSIGWTDFSVNMLKYRNAKGVTVWACVHASEGCRFCYSEALAKRWGRGEAFTAEKMKGLTPFFDTSEAQQVLRSKKISGKKVFVDDMTDLFGEWVPDEVIDQHFQIFAARQDVTFQVLTKRAKRMQDYFRSTWNRESRQGYCHFQPEARVFCLHQNGIPSSNEITLPFPLPNVHLGVSVEDPDNKLRLAYLRNTPAAVHWASLEPFLEHMEFDHLIAVLDGIVIGGESGAKYRAMPISSALTLARRAKEAGVAVYVKQDSGPRPGMQGRIPDDVWALKEWPTANSIPSTQTAIAEV